MPCATIHMLTAGRVLSAWTGEPGRAPIPIRSERIRTAFLVGAMGPDIGFLPGVDRFVSELSHYVSTADLTRALLREAETAEQEAFTWGWATHHLTDVEIHPLVGLACGEHVRGDRSVRMNASEDVVTHVAMEVGLDLVFLGSDPRIPRPPVGPTFDGDAIGFMSRALEQTYEIPWRPERVTRALRRGIALTGRWPTMLGLVGRGRGLGPGRGARRWRSVLRPALDVAGRFMPDDAPVAGLLRPLRPPSWLVSRIREIAEGFPARFQALVEGGLRDLENRNLETGLLEHEPVDHPDSERTFQRLRKLRTS